MIHSVKVYNNAGEAIIFPLLNQSALISDCPAAKFIYIRQFGVLWTQYLNSINSNLRLIFTSCVPSFPHAAATA